MSKIVIDAVVDDMDGFESLNRCLFFPPPIYIIFGGFVLVSIIEINQT